MKIARSIQLSLLPQGLPQLRRYDVAVIYEPIQEVGGDYYDILKKRKNIQPLVLADVEGKGLAAALLAASCQAVFHGSHWPAMSAGMSVLPPRVTGKKNRIARASSPRRMARSLRSAERRTPHLVALLPKRKGPSVRL